jgi:hypothetical protein
MAATTLVREALYRVSLQLQDYGNPAQFTRWTSGELARWWNDAQRAVAKYLPSAFARVDAIKLTAGPRQSIASVTAARIKPGDGSTSVDRTGMRIVAAPFRNMGSDGLTPGKVVRIADRASLDAVDPLWQKATASSVSEIILEPMLPRDFWVYPGVPTTRDVWIELAMVWMPLDISTAGDYTIGGGNAALVSIDDAQLDDAVNWTCMRAKMKDAEEAGSLQEAMAFATMFASSINAQSVSLGLPNPKLTAQSVMAAARGA